MASVPPIRDGKRQLPRQDETVPSDAEAASWAKAYEANLRAYCRAIAAAGDGFICKAYGTELTALPYTYWINGLVSPRLSRENALEQVEDILSRFRKLQREVWFTLGPSTRPADLALTLRRRRLWSVHNRPFMACPAESIQLRARPIRGIKVYAVEDYGIFESSAHPLLGRMTTPRTRGILGSLERLTRARHRKHWLLVAEAASELVGTATAYVHRAVGGIYDVEVADPWQGRGIGTALVEAACSRVLESGAELAVLAASEQGVGFYPRFGFVEVGRYPTYNYSMRKQRLDATRPGWWKEARRT